MNYHLVPRCPICNEKTTIGKIKNRQGTSTFFCSDCCIEFILNKKDKTIKILKDE